jgi:hypothetical protein
VYLGCTRFQLEQLIENAHIRSLISGIGLASSISALSANTTHYASSARILHIVNAVSQLIFSMVAVPILLTFLVLSPQPVVIIVWMFSVHDGA